MRQLTVNKICNRLVVSLIVCRRLLATCGGNRRWANDHSQMLVVVWNVDKSFPCCACLLLIV